MGAVTTFESGFEASLAGGTQRLDVIPAGPARRRWTSEAKARIVAESLAPGVNVSAVARRHGLLPQQLYAWRRRVSERIEVGNGTAFVPAMVEEALPLASGGAFLGVEIRVEFNGVKMFVPVDAGADHVERVLLAVRAAS